MTVDELLTGELAIESVLRTLLEAACAATSARGGVLDAVGSAEGLEHVLHTGPDLSTVGGGESRLALPIRVDDTVVGRLVLFGSARGHFTLDDEERVQALAFAASAVIVDAREPEARRVRGWQRASAEIGTALLASGADPLPALALRAFQLAGAELATIGLLTPDGTELVVEAAYGTGADDLLAARLPATVGAVAQAVSGQAATEVEHGTGRVRGVLTLTRRRGGAAFTPAEVAMAADFAAHASVALELADFRATEQRVVLLEDRDRIARDLHDHVIQELFAIGLRLETVSAGLGPESTVGHKISERVEDIDRTIRRIRTSIFALRGPMDVKADGLRQHILEIASDLTPALGFPAHVSFDGPVDLSTSPHLGDDIVAVVREALTNVAKHARASAASVDVSVRPGEIVVTVFDNGRGMGDTTRSSGLGNLRSRAERYGGTLSVARAAGGGTLLTWKAAVR